MCKVVKIYLSSGGIVMNYSEGSGKQYHIAVGEGEVGKYVILRDVKKLQNILKIQYLLQITESMLLIQVI